MHIEVIYVRLLDEGVDVSRPVKAIAVGASSYCLLLPDDYDPDDEKWEFKPGQIVRVEKHQFPNLSGLLAVSAEPIGSRA